MLRYTRNTVIAFDFKDASAFEGETGRTCSTPSFSRANIFRKAGVTEEAALAAVADLDLSELNGEEGNSLWETWLLASASHRADRAGHRDRRAGVPRALRLPTRAAVQQLLHRHHILTEQDTTRRALLLATAAVARARWFRALAYLGIESPPVM